MKEIYVLNSETENFIRSRLGLIWGIVVYCKNVDFFNFLKLTGHPWIKIISNSERVTAKQDLLDITEFSRSEKENYREVYFKSVIHKSFIISAYVASNDINSNESLQKSIHKFETDISKVFPPDTIHVYKLHGPSEAIRVIMESPPLINVFEWKNSAIKWPEDINSIESFTQLLFANDDY